MKKKCHPFEKKYVFGVLGSFAIVMIALSATGNSYTEGTSSLKKITQEIQESYQISYYAQPEARRSSLVVLALKAARGDGGSVIQSVPKD